MITFISTLDGDWCGMYFYDKLVIEDHSLDGARVASQLVKLKADLEYESVQTGSITERCIEEYGWRLPQRLQDVEVDSEWPLEKYEI